MVRINICKYVHDFPSENDSYSRIMICTAFLTAMLTVVYCAYFLFFLGR